MQENSKMDLVALYLLSGIFCINSALSREFHYVRYNKNWIDAQRYCRVRFDDLATIESSIEINSVLQKVAAVDPLYQDSVWIGLKRSWVWSSGEPLSTYRPWNTYEPNEGNDNAACVVSSYGWSDWFCWNNHYFFCVDESPTASSRFTLITSSMSWLSARTYCKQHYTDLAVVTNAQDQQTLNAMGGGWIGLTTAQWSDKTFTLFRYWKTGQAFETTDVNNCVVMDMLDSGKWNSLSCTLQKRFICYGAVDKMKVRQLLRVVLTSDGVTNLNDPSVQAAILSKIEKKVKERVMNENVKVWWKVNNGSIF